MSEESLSKPKQWYEKSVVFKPRAFFESLSSLISGGGATAATSNPAPSLAAATNTLIQSIGLEKDSVGASVYRLTLAALLDASKELVSELEDRLATDPSNVMSIKDSLADVLEMSPITADLYQHPERLELLNPIKDVLKKWGIIYSLREAEAEAFANRLVDYFPNALFRISLKEEFKDDLDKIKALDDNPFLEAHERRLSWERYKRHLNRLMAAPVLDEAFGLRDIYIPLRAIYVATAEDETQKEAPHRFYKKRVALDLEKVLDEWLQAEGDPIRVVSGGPGSGKSSFAKHYAAHVMNCEFLKVLHIPLIHFPKGKELENGIKDILENQKILKYDPLDVASDDDLLVILDGLDEVAMTSQGALSEISKLIREVVQLAPLRNTGRKLKFLLLGRTSIVQFEQQERAIKGEQILELLPYVLPELNNRRWVGEENEDGNVYIYHRFIITNFPLKDQRKEWWGKFSRLKGLAEDGIPEKLRGKREHHLFELTSVPILNYLVAWNYLQDTEAFDPDDNINSLYQNLFESVYKRSWGQPSPGNPAAASFDLEEFSQVYESIALTAWHEGGGRSARMKDIATNIWPVRVKTKYERLEPDTKQGAMKTLTAFYTRLGESDEQGNETFEFMHKSFGEYLTSRRLVNRMKNIHDKLGNDIDEAEALRYWLDDCRTGIFTDDLQQMIENEVVKQASAGAEGFHQMQETLSTLLEYGIKIGMPMHDKTMLFPNYKAMENGARTALLGLLIMHQAYAKQTTQISDFLMEEFWSADHFISFLRAGRERERIMRLPLSSIDFGGHFLDGSNLNRAQLRFANFRHSYLDSTSFLIADLSNVVLSGAECGAANFSHANLSDADMTNSGFFEAKFVGARLRDANMSNARFWGADFSKADLTNAKFDNADLSFANFTGVDFGEVDLSKSKSLFGAILPKDKEDELKREKPELFEQVEPRIDKSL